MCVCVCVCVCVGGATRRELGSGRAGGWPGPAHGTFASSRRRNALSRLPRSLRTQYKSCKQRAPPITDARLQRPLRCQHTADRGKHSWHIYYFDFAHHTERSIPSHCRMSSTAKYFDTRMLHTVVTNCRSHAVLIIGFFV